MDVIRKKDLSSLPRVFFNREDEGDDELFYNQPRLVVHIDEGAILAIGHYFWRALPSQGVLLDLMSSWRSHLPEGFSKTKMVGVGLNAEEMANNPQLDEWTVHNLNVNPVLPFKDEVFDAVIVTVSIQYLTRPEEVFQQVQRVLRPGAWFHVIYSNRMFPTKAINAWRAFNDAQRAELIFEYFRSSGGWEEPRLEECRIGTSVLTDPIYVVAARRSIQL